jgi:hypothetical protein
MFTSAQTREHHYFELRSDADVSLTTELMAAKKAYRADGGEKSANGVDGARQSVARQQPVTIANTRNMKSVEHCSLEPIPLSIALISYTIAS